MEALDALQVETGRRDTLIGREFERAVISRLVDAAQHSRSGALVLRGENGVGKSALVDFFVERATDMRVLHVVGVEPESGLAFAALHQLLRPVLPCIDRIPAVQADALKVALGLAQGVAENKFVIALGVLSVLAEAAADGPVLCVIDDAHSIDHASAEALAFAARRLEAEGIVMLFTVREDAADSFPGFDLPELPIRGLTPGDAELLLAQRFGDRLPLEIRQALVESAQGNPLVLLEAPDALSPAQRSGRAALPEPMPMGRSLEDVLLARVRRLTAPAQLLLLLTAAESSGEADVIMPAAVQLGIPSAALVEAQAAGLLRSEGLLLRFRHPALRAAIYQGAGLPERHTAHRALASALQGSQHAERRVWHRAAVAAPPDDGIADDLEVAAERASARSGFMAASRALRRAAELTSEEGLRSRRRVAAARAALNAGRPDDATALLRVAEDDLDLHGFTEMRSIQGEIANNCGVPREGAILLSSAAERVAPASPRKAVEMLFDAALYANFAGDIPLLRGIAAKAFALPVVDEEPESTLVELLAAVAELLGGKDAGARDRLLGPLDRLADVADPRWLVWAGAAASLVGDQRRDDLFRSRAEAVARQSMAVGSLAMVLARSAWSNLINHGRVVAASHGAEEGLRLALEAGLTNHACLHRSILAWVAAVRGDRERCLAYAELALDTALNHELPAHNSTANWAVGLLHLGDGRWEEATTRLEHFASPIPGMGHPYVAMRALPDLVEAAVRAGCPDVAEAATARYSDYAQGGVDNPLQALAVRCRALVAETPASREELLSRALVLHVRNPRPFDRARTLLLMGEHLRRERRRAEARVPLGLALDIFDQLGALRWAERARRELRATGQTMRRREAASTEALTRQEQQVVHLVSMGASNKEAAAQMFLSPRTVEYHLRKVFTKFGVTSRTELVRLHRESAAAQ